MEAKSNPNAVGLVPQDLTLARKQLEKVKDKDFHVLNHVFIPLKHLSKLKKDFESEKNKLDGNDENSSR